MSEGLLVVMVHIGLRIMSAHTRLRCGQLWSGDHERAHRIAARAAAECAIALRAEVNTHCDQNQMTCIAAKQCTSQLRLICAGRFVVGGTDHQSLPHGTREQR